MKKLRVGVLMGGKSIEREVSFNSGRTVCDHLDTARYDIIPIFQTHAGDLFILPWHFLHRGKITDFDHRLEAEAKSIVWDDLKQLIDFMYIAVHGRYAEDGTLQGFLEVLGIPYLGSDVFASALGMDKIKQKDMLRMQGIDVPSGINVTPAEVKKLDVEKIITELPLPLVVKPYKEGSSLGITVVFEKKELLPAIKKACTIHPGEEQSILIEEKLEGMEFSCITITDYKTGDLIALPPTEVEHQEGTHLHDYDQKYMPGLSREFTPPRCDETLIKKIQDTCVRAMTALGITNISRIDGFVTKDERIVLVDPNTLSGMGPASFLFREAAEHGMNHTQLINHLIETELQSYGMLEKIISQEKNQEKIMKTKLRVAVLMGGNTNEREISLESGRNITYKLSPHKYEALPLFVSSKMELFHIPPRLLVRNATAEIESLVEPSMKVAWNDLPNIADFVFIGLHGGAGENGGVQGTLEMLGLPYNGSGVLASALCMDKYKTNQFLESKGFYTPKALLISKVEANRKKIVDELSLPLIIKPHDDGCSMLVQMVKREEDINKALNKIFRVKNYALVEECITGMELTIGVIGNNEPRALPPSQVVCTGDILSIEEKFLPGAGENQTPAPLPKAALEFVQKKVAAAYKALDCKGYARIDCFYQDAEQSPTGEQKVIFIEVNSLPGMTPATCIFHQAAEVGIRPMDFVDLIIQHGLEQHSKVVSANKKRTTSQESHQ